MGDTEYLRLKVKRKPRCTVYELSKELCASPATIKLCRNGPIETAEHFHPTYLHPLTETEIQRNTIFPSDIMKL